MGPRSARAPRRLTGGRERRPPVPAGRLDSGNPAVIGDEAHPQAPSSRRGRLDAPSVGDADGVGAAFPGVAARAEDGVVAAFPGVAARAEDGVVAETRVRSSSAPATSRPAESMANQATAATTATADSQTTAAASQRHPRTRTTSMPRPVQLQE